MITGDTRPEPVEIRLGQNLGMSKKEGHLKIMEDKLSLEIFFWRKNRPKIEDLQIWGQEIWRFLPNNNWWCNQ